MIICRYHICICNFSIQAEQDGITEKWLFDFADAIISVSVTFLTCCPQSFSSAHKYAVLHFSGPFSDNAVFSRKNKHHNDYIIF